MACRTCGLPLNSRTTGESTTVEWRHPLHVISDHDPDPAPQNEAPRVQMVCDFCTGTPTWLYHTRTELSDTKALPTFTGREDRRRIGRDVERVRAEQGTPAELGRHVFSTGWAACIPCAELIELRDMERLITRLRRLHPDRFARISRNVLRDLYRPLFASIYARTPITNPQTP